jgi:small conductance mechanosensitive channel
MDEIVPKLQEWITFYGLKVLAAIVIFIVGRWIAKALKRLTERVMTKNNVDPTIISFVGDLTYVALLVFVVVAAINQIGVQTTSFIAIIGAAGLAVGFALQGSLANFAAGFLLILFRPFKVGDYIEGAGVAGVVEEIQVFVTELTTPDNKAVIIPNSKLTGDNIINYSAKGTRRIDLVVGVSYDADLTRAKDVLNEVVLADDRILKDPAPQIAVSELADSSVNFVVRPWVKSDDYWAVYFDTTENMKRRLDAEGIGIPFPQRDVHMYQQAT